MVHDETQLCPFAGCIAELGAPAQSPVLVQLGDGPPSLREAILAGRAEGLILDHELPDPSLAGLLYRHAVDRVDLLFIGLPLMLDRAMEALDSGDIQPRLVLVGAGAIPPEGPSRTRAVLLDLGYATSVSPAGLLARRERPCGISRADHAALLAHAGPAQALPLLRLSCAAAPHDAAGRRRLIETLMAQGQVAEAMAELAGWRRHGGDMAAMGEVAMAASAATLAGFNRLLAAGDIEAAERHAAALAEVDPGNAALLGAALACNRRLGHGARVRRFARRLLALDPHHLAAHMGMLEHQPEDELASRACLALAPERSLHPLRRLHDAHRAISLMLLRPLDAAGWQLLREIVAAARRVDPDALEDQEQRLWARHYRLLVEAADPASPPAGDEPPPFDMAPLISTPGAPLSWAQLRRRQLCRAAELVFVVAADAAYLRLYGRPYLLSILRHCDVPALILVHVIGGRQRLAELIRCLDIDDPRLLFTADDFAAGAVTTQCHDSDGPRRLPVAHFQCVRFAVAERVLAELRRPVIVSDIDVILQRGVRDLLEKFRDRDVVLNRNEASESFGSHITANLALLYPTAAAVGFMSDLRACLTACLAAPHVTRWIDQCGLHLCWQRQASSQAGTRFGWFDTAADINNVMYRRYEANPFRFLSLFHGFEMASLPRFDTPAAA